MPFLISISAVIEFRPSIRRDVNRRNISLLRFVNVHRICDVRCLVHVNIFLVAYFLAKLIFFWCKSRQPISSISKIKKNLSVTLYCIMMPCSLGLYAAIWLKTNGLTKEDTGATPPVIFSKLWHKNALFFKKYQNFSNGRLHSRNPHSIFNSLDNRLEFFGYKSKYFLWKCFKFVGSSEVHFDVWSLLSNVSPPSLNWPCHHQISSSHPKTFVCLPPCIRLWYFGLFSKLIIKDLNNFPVSNQ